jgi:hypothetical protein
MHRRQVLWRPLSGRWRHLPTAHQTRPDFNARRSGHPIRREAWLDEERPSVNFLFGLVARKTVTPLDAINQLFAGTVDLRHILFCQPVPVASSTPPQIRPTLFDVIPFHAFKPVPRLRQLGRRLPGPGVDPSPVSSALGSWLRPYRAKEGLCQGSSLPQTSALCQGVALAKWQICQTRDDRTEVELKSDISVVARNGVSDDRSTIRNILLTMLAF